MKFNEMLIGSFSLASEAWPFFRAPYLMMHLISRDHKKGWETGTESEKSPLLFNIVIIIAVRENFLDSLHVEYKSTIFIGFFFAQFI